MAYAFDPTQPGARRLAALAQEVKRAEKPTPVEITAPVWLPEEAGPFEPGDRAVLPAALADRLIDDGLARPAG
jgi:hypothetical protein